MPSRIRQRFIEYRALEPCESINRSNRKYIMNNFGEKSNHPQTILALTRAQRHSQTPPPAFPTAEFRLLSVKQIHQPHCLELTCYRLDRIQKAQLSGPYLAEVSRWEGRTVKIDHEISSLGHEPIMNVRRIELLESASDPLAVPAPLWLRPSQAGTYMEFRRLIQTLEPAYRDLVLEVFRDDKYLEAFLNRPASLAHHHRQTGGLIAHTLELMRDVVATCQLYRTANTSLTLAAAILHDIGKCDEYLATVRGQNARSLEGELEMHKQMGVGIIKLAANRACCDPTLVSEVIHCITSANGADYMGLSRQKMIEAVIVQTADARSSFASMMNAAPEVGYRSSSRDKYIRSIRK
jgi:hypothetical protein